MGFFGKGIVGDISKSSFSGLWGDNLDYRRLVI